MKMALKMKILSKFSKKFQKIIQNKAFFLFVCNKFDTDAVFIHVKVHKSEYVVKLPGICLLWAFVFRSE
jgi:hypothetical protein